MKIIFLISIFLNLSASVINMDYIGELSIFGKVGSASIYYKNDGKNYHIKIIGAGSGIVATLTKHRYYVYESIGRVEDNKLIPMKYIESQSSRDLNKTVTYTFDYENSKTIITKYKKELKKESIFDIISLTYRDRSRVIENNTTKELDRVYQDDMISVFFNKRHNLLSMKKGETKLIFAVGSKDTQKGMIVKLIKKVDKKFIYSITINKDYLSGGSNDATFVLDSDNILYETSLDGILFFGKATIRRLDSKELLNDEINSTDYNKNKYY